MKNNHVIVILNEARHENCSSEEVLANTNESSWLSNMAAEVANASNGDSSKPLVALRDVMEQLMDQEASRWRTISANPSLAASNSGTSMESTNTSDTVSELFLIR